MRAAYFSIKIHRIFFYVYAPLWSKLLCLLDILIYHSYSHSHCNGKFSSSARPSTEDITYPDAYLYSRSTPFNQQGYVEALVEQKRPVKKFVLFLPPLISHISAILSGAQYHFLCRPRHSGSFWGHKKTTEGGNKKRQVCYYHTSF